MSGQPDPEAHPDWVRQSDYTVRCEWGPLAIEALAPESDVVVIVDVLSFSTAVDVAVARGASVFPYRFRDESAAAFAKEKEALLAGRNLQGYSLKPSSLVAIEAGCRLVLPSPNGSTLSLEAGRLGRVALAGCLRNRSAVARRAAGLATAPRASILVVPAGERWKSDGSLRPAFEDLCGAGSVIDALPETLSRSPEAEAARQVFRNTRDLTAQLAACASGREKHAMQDAGDVALAAALDVSDCVPVLEDGAYSASSRSASTRSG